MNRWVSWVASGLLSLALSLCPAPVAVAKNPPPPVSLGAGIDAHLGYRPQATCSPAAKPGTKALLAALIATWGGSSYGISRLCNVGTTSEHKEGRALDWHMDVKSASQRARVADALTWITANNGEVAYRLGIMYILWNQHIWSIYYQELGWRPMADRGSYTANHKNHVHISLSWDGAMAQTSWWTGQSRAVPLDGPCGKGPNPACLPRVRRAISTKWPIRTTVVSLPFLPYPGPVPSIGGSPQVGRQLTAVPGTWVPDGAALSYAWLRDGTPIADATGPTYLVQPADVGAELRVRVTATVGQASTTRTSDGMTEALRGVFTTAQPAISGTARTDGLLTVSPGDWLPAPTALAYQWRRDGKAIAGATAPTFQVRPTDVRHDLSCTVTASAPGFVTASRRSGRVRPVKAVLAQVPVPWVEGVVVTGGVLTAVPGEWLPAPVSLSYRWYRNQKAIKGATRVTYRLVKADRGKSVTVRVVGKRAGYVSASVVSAPAGTPLPSPVDPGSVPSVSPTPAPPTPAPGPSVSATPTPTPGGSATPTPTWSPAATPTPTPTWSPTMTPTLP